MSTRNNLLALIFLMGVLAFMIFAVKRLLLRPIPAKSGVAALLEKGKPSAKPLEPKPSAAVPAPSSTAPPSSTPASSSAPSSKAQDQVATSAAGGASAASAKARSPAAKSAATATTKDRRPEDHRPEDHRPQLRFDSGARLWIRVTAINRKPDGSFTFRGTLLQPVALANTNQLDQGTELAGSGTVNNGHVTVLVTGFTIGGANYALLQNDTSGSKKRPGTGLAVELDPGKLLEVWLASSSVYRETPSK